MYRVSRFVTNYALLLLIGAGLALLWANANPGHHDRLADYPLFFNDWIGVEAGRWLEHFGALYGIAEVPAARVLSVHYLVNDMAMALFFALAGKEVWEAVILRNGALRGRRAATPLIATAGGVLGPVIVYLGLAALLGSDVYDAVANGWAVPTATDVAFAYVFGRLIFGAGHPAVRFLLLLAIADDAVGLVILAVFYPTVELAPVWLLLSLGAALAAFVLFNWLPRRLDRGDQLRQRSTWVRRRLGLWPYALAGAISWYGFQQSGLHPALGLLPVIPAIPHSDRAFGIFAEAEEYLTDLLNRAEHLLKYPVGIILFVFGLLNAGVPLSAVSAPTLLVLCGLLLGKPAGILLFGWLAAHPLKLGLPTGMRTADLAVIGCVAGVGFTVSLFIAAVAFDPGPVQDAARAGALFSLVSGGVAIAAARLLGVVKRPV